MKNRQTKSTLVCLGVFLYIFMHESYILNNSATNRLTNYGTILINSGISQKAEVSPGFSLTNTCYTRKYCMFCSLRC